MAREALNPNNIVKELEWEIQTNIIFTTMAEALSGMNE